MPDFDRPCLHACLLQRQSGSLIVDHSSCQTRQAVGAFTALGSCEHLSVNHRGWVMGFTGLEVLHLAYALAGCGVLCACMFIICSRRKRRDRTINSVVLTVLHLPAAASSLHGPAGFDVLHL